jgi:DNA-binding GntR family transcriptional regulator
MLLDQPAPLRDRQTAAGFVTDSLRDAIQSGRLVDGAELNQVALAEYFGTSRVPVREALRALEAEGWISALPHRRAVVQTLSPERVDEIFDVRRLLETHLVRKAAATVDTERVNALLAICDAMDGMRDHHAWVAANHRFHHELLATAASPMTLELIEQLSSQVERYLRQHGEDVIREAEAGAEHRAIVAALAEHDGSHAALLLDAHIDRTRRRVLAALDRQRTLTPHSEKR